MHAESEVRANLVLTNFNLDKVFNIYKFDPGIVELHIVYCS